MPEEFPFVGLVTVDEEGERKATTGREGSYDGRRVGVGREG